MNISKGLISGIIVLFTISGFAQSKSEVDFISEELGLKKEVIIKRFVKPSKENKAAFDKVYAEYNLEQKELSAEKFELLKLYAQTWETMTDEEANAWTLKTFKLGTKRDKLLQEYYVKVKNATNAKLATQFLQVEIYALSVVRNAIFKEMPFVDDEMDKKK